MPKLLLNRRAWCRCCWWWILSHVRLDTLRVPITLMNGRGCFAFILLVLFCATGFTVLLLAQCLGFKFMPVTFDLL